MSYHLSNFIFVELSKVHYHSKKNTSLVLFFHLVFLNPTELSIRHAVFGILGLNDLSYTFLQGVSKIPINFRIAAIKVVPAYKVLNSHIIRKPKNGDP